VRVCVCLDRYRCTTEPMAVRFGLSGIHVCVRLLIFCASVFACVCVCVSVCVCVCVFV